MESAVALHGLGGMGKTRLAVEYALRHRNEYSALLFASASTAEGLDDDFAALCAPRVLNLPEREAKEESVRVAAALRWLDEHPGWLLVLDNVDTLDAAKAVQERLGQLLSGHVIVTTRLGDWRGGVELLEVDELNEDDSVAFLLERTEGHRRASPTDEADALALAKELGGLALALEQAGAFVSKLRGSLGDYLRRWREREPEVREWHDATLMAYPRPLAVTWDTTVSQLDAAALALLRLLSWLAAEPVPRALLETDAAKQALVAAVSRLEQRDGASNADMEDALATLAGFSLLKWEACNEAFRVHRLVQELTQDRLPADERNDWLQATLGLLNAWLPGEPPPKEVRSWPSWEGMRSHVEAVIGLADAAGIREPTARLMNELSLFLMAKAIHARAEPLARRALAIDEATYGPEHPKVAIRLNNLASLLLATNRHREAEPLMRRVVEIFEKSPGPEHSNVATSLNNLASLLLATNRRREAEPLMRRVVEIFEKSLGPEHPSVATSLNNLGALLHETNRLEEAEPLVRRALAIDEASHGPEHPDVATDLSNLAQLLQARNRLGEAEPLLRRALAIDEASYGPAHPEVARDLNNLAQLLRPTGRLGEAETLMRRALAIDATTYGPEHPKVAIRLNNLALLLQARNRLGEAEPLLRRALVIDETSYGPEHPGVARDLTNLASLLQATGGVGEAEPLMRRALAVDEASYGAEHPEVATDLNNLASLLRATGRLGEAEPLMRRAVMIFERSLGPEHPKVATSLNNLAQLLQATNRLGEAEPLMRRHLEIFLRFTRDTGYPHPHLGAAVAKYEGLLRAMGYTESDIGRQLEALKAKELGSRER
jgi:tetratricopeptide (TPR) repeat protein